MKPCIKCGGTSFYMRVISNYIGEIDPVTGKLMAKEKESEDLDSLECSHCGDTDDNPENIFWDVEGKA